MKAMYLHSLTQLNLHEIRELWMVINQWWFVNMYSVRFDVIWMMIPFNSSILWSKIYTCTVQSKHPCNRAASFQIILHGITYVHVYHLNIYFFFTYIFYLLSLIFKLCMNFRISMTYACLRAHQVYRLDYFKTIVHPPAAA